MATTYDTNDLYKAAFLVASGIVMLPPRRDPRGKVSFCFTMEEGDGELLTHWTLATATVQAVQYAQAIKSLKEACHDTHWAKG